MKSSICDSLREASYQIKWDYNSPTCFDNRKKQETDMTTKQVNETMVLIPTKKIRTIRVAMESLIEGKEYPVVYDQELRDFVIYDELGDPWASLTDRIKMGIFNVIYIDASGDDRIDERAKQLVSDILFVGVWDSIADVYDIEVLAEDLAVGITNLIREIENR